MISTGQIKIKIQPDGSHCKVALTSTRPRNLSRVFTGKSVVQMLDFVPLLFSICRNAQTVAAVRAAEQAMGDIAAAEIEHERDRLISLEMLQEHLWTLLMGLPPLLEMPVQQQEMARFVQSLQQPIQQLRLQVGRVASEIDRFSLSQSIPEMDLTSDLLTFIFGDQFGNGKPNKGNQLDSGFAGELLRTLQKADFNVDKCDGDKNAIIRQFPANEERTKGSSVLHSADQDLVVGNRPSGILTDHWFFAYQTPSSSESGSLARMRNHPWVQERQGRVLCSRLAAVLAETSRLLQGAVFASPPGRDCDPRTGCAEVETARGRLTCALAVSEDEAPSASALADDTARLPSLSGGLKNSAKPNNSQMPIVSQLRILAPTDQHFHATGVAMRELSQLPAERELLLQRAKLLIRLINPCVDYCVDVIPLTDVVGGEHRCRQSETAPSYQQKTTDCAVGPGNA